MLDSQPSAEEKRSKVFSTREQEISGRFCDLEEIGALRDHYYHYIILIDGQSFDLSMHLMVNMEFFWTKYFFLY